MWMMRKGSSSNISRLYGQETNDWIESDGGTEQWKFYLNGIVEMTIGQTGFVVPNVYTSQAGTSANVYVSSTGQLTRLTSALKYKTKVIEAPQLADITLRPVEYTSKQHKSHHYGLIADDVAGQLHDAGIWNKEELEDYDTRAVIAILAAKVNRLEKLLEEHNGN